MTWDRVPGARPHTCCYVWQYDLELQPLQSPRWVGRPKYGRDLERMLLDYSLSTKELFECFLIMKKTLKL